MWHGGKSASCGRIWGHVSAQSKSIRPSATHCMRVRLLGLRQSSKRRTRRPLILCVRATSRHLARFCGSWPSDHYATRRGKADMSLDRRTGSSTSPRCDVCAYDLTGLSPTGRCPECGSDFDTNARRSFTPRPPFGHLLMVIPPLLLPPAILVLNLTFFHGGFVLIFLTPLVCLVLSILISKRLADWQYSVALRRSIRRRDLPPRKSFVAARFAIYMGTQLLACWAGHRVGVYLIAWLTQICVLPRGWS